MLSSVLAGFLIGTTAPAQRPVRDLVAQAGIKRTGTNGYEDYLDAASLMSGVNVEIDEAPSRETIADLERELAVAEAQLKNGSSERDRSVAEMTRDSAVASLQRLRPLVGTTLFQRQRSLVERTSRAWELIRRGNSKFVTDPRSAADATILFPEHASFRQLTKLARHRVAFEIASGRGDKAVETFIDAYMFTSKLPPTSLIAYFVQAAMYAILHRELDRWLPQLPAARLDQLISALSLKLSQNSAQLAYERDLDSTIQFVSKLFSDPTNFDDPDDAQSAALRKMTDSERQAILRRTVARVESYRPISRQHFALPEANWADAQPTAARPSEDEIDIGEMITPDAVGKVEIRLRAQARCAMLSVRAVKFRWEAGQFPRRLEEFVSEREAIDPLNGQTFELISNSGTLAIRSRGLRSTGPIGLFYRPPKPETPDPMANSVRSESGRQLE